MPTQRLFGRYPTFPTDVLRAATDRIAFSEIEEGNVSASKTLFRACSTKGYFLLDLDTSSHGRSLLSAAEDVFETTTEVFDAGSATLNAFSVDLPRDIQGYKCTGKIKTDHGKRDACEFYTIHQDDLTGVGPVKSKPDALQKRLDDCRKFVRRTYEAINVILRTLDKELDLPEGTLISRCSIQDESTTALRLLRAHPVGSDAIENDDRPIKLGGHTDIGTITMLFNVLGGLQILPAGQEKKEENWEYVQPQPGCALVQIGDTLVEWTGGVLRSNLHRVVDAPGSQAKHVRQSVVYLQRASENASMKRLKQGNIIPPLATGEQEEIRRPSEWVVWRNSQIMQGKLKPESSGGVNIFHSPSITV